MLQLGKRSYSSFSFHVLTMKTFWLLASVLQRLRKCVVHRTYLENENFPHELRGLGLPLEQYNLQSFNLETCVTLIMEQKLFLGIHQTFHSTFF